jgi:hypothetical protein
MRSADVAVGLAGERAVSGVPVISPKWGRIMLGAGIVLSLAACASDPAPEAEMARADLDRIRRLQSRAVATPRQRRRGFPDQPGGRAAPDRWPRLRRAAAGRNQRHRRRPSAEPARGARDSRCRRARTGTARRRSVAQISRLAPGTHSTSAAPRSFRWRARTNRWSESRLRYRIATGLTGSRAASSVVSRSARRATVRA